MKQTNLPTNLERLRELHGIDSTFLTFDTKFEKDDTPRGGHAFKRQSCKFVIFTMYDDPCYLDL